MKKIYVRGKEQRKEKESEYMNIEQINIYIPGFGIEGVEMEIKKCKMRY